MDKREFAQRLHSDYVKDDCVQVMLGYIDFAQIYGNDGMMYYHYLLRNIPCDGSETARIDIDRMNKPVNNYLLDDRNTLFPYSAIPCHKERVGLFRKLNFTNQILDYEKPYIKVNDGIITKLTAYKDDESAIVHTQILNNQYESFKELIVSREELENYLNTGNLPEFDTDNYTYKQIFDLRGGLFDISLEPDDYYISLSKREITDSISPALLTERTTAALRNMLSNLDESLAYLVLKDKKMIKFGSDNKVAIDTFTVIYMGKDKFKVQIAKTPLTKEDLYRVKDRIGSSNITVAKNPKINTKILKKRVLID